MGFPNRMKCHKLPQPYNGAVRCGGTLCFIQCDDGYTYSTFNPFIVYKCLADGTWTTIPYQRHFPWPDCIEVSPCNLM